LAQSVKHFEGLYTQIAVSESGYIAIYYPYEPEIVGSFWKGLAACPEQQERLVVLHISQINDIDIEYGGTETTKVSGGAGGAIVGGLLGGALGSVIGSSLTSGKVKSTTTITDATMVINTKDFNNPRMEVELYKRYVPGKSYHLCCPLMLRGYLDKNLVHLSKEGKMVAEQVYGVKNGFYEKLEPNIAQIEILESTLTQMLAAQQQSELAAAAAPQVSSADELIKYKSLLDSGVITQQEFEAKKRQLLGL